MNSKTNKGFIPVIIILVILIGIVGIYSLRKFKFQTTITVSPFPISNSMITGWKIFSDQQGKFSISYPNDWDIRVSDGGLSDISSSKYPTLGPQGNAGIYFNSFKNDKNIKLLEWVNKYGHGQGELPSSVYSQTKLNGIPAVEINYVWTKEFIDWLNKNYPITDTEGPPPIGTKFREIYVQNEDTIISIETSFLSFSENDNNFFKEVDQILSTFKLID